MQRKLTMALTGVFTFLLFSALTVAQDEPADQLYFVHKDVIIANMVPQYEKAVTDLLEQFKLHNFGGEIRFASSTDENEYFYLTPLSSYADLEAQDGYWTDLYSKADEETMANIDKQFEGCYEHHNNYVIKLSGELSYQAENPRLKPEDINFIHWDYYQIEEGQEMKAMELVKKYKELWAKNNITDSYNMWMADIGHDMGMMVVTQSAKDAADYYDQREKRRKLMKDEIDILNAQFLPLMKDFEHKNGKPHPEWSYSPAK